MDELMRMLAGPGAHTYWRAEPSRLMFETPEAGAGGEGGEGGGEGAAVVDPAATVDPAAGGEPSAQELAGAGLSREDYLALAQEGAGAAFQEMLAEAERQELEARERAQAQQRAQQGQQLPPWDPFDVNVVTAYQEAAMRRVLGPLVEAIGPALETTEQVRMDQGRGEAVDILTRHQEELGEFDHDRAILSAARYAQQGLEPQQALERAAKEERAYVEKIEAAAFQRARETGQNLADLTPEPAGGTGAAAEVLTHPGTPGGKIDYRKSLEGSLARMGKRPGVTSPTG